MDTQVKKRQELIGQNLRKYRTIAKLTQGQLAQQAGISISYYARLERGNRSMSAWVLYSLANALNVSADCLLYEESQHTPMESIRYLLRGKPDDTVADVVDVIQTLLDRFTAKREGNPPEK